MKKIFNLCSLLLLTACLSKPYDTEFKNPLFNQPLEPLGKSSGYTYLSPTFIDFRTPLDKNQINGTGKCDLIENKQDRITLKCKVMWSNNDEFDYYFTYVIKDLFVPGCLRILEYSYLKPEKFPPNEDRAAKYCVTPPDNLSKPD